MEYIGLDFETYASTDLTKHGLHRYVNCPDFRPLLAAAVTLEDGWLFDFTYDYEEELKDLAAVLDGRIIVAHNATFEQSVLHRIGIDIPSERFIDSAVLARMAGAAGKLEAAAPQLLGVDKLESGRDLIQLFSIPGKYQEKNGITAFDPAVRDDHLDQWEEFARYCVKDAELSLRLAHEFDPFMTDIDRLHQAVTMDMNNVGWKVDIPLVENMQRRYQANLDRTVAEFRTLTGDMLLNLNSHPQLVTWCANRGVKATSFDEVHVERLIKSLTKKLESSTLDHTKRGNYTEVLLLLRTKQILGGSSLKKLITILDTVGTDGRLHDQYLHVGAGATWRTTGRGVQMQNLKRLNGEGDDMEELFDVAVMWSNDKLATNLRQVFTATDPNGRLIVGDFSSVESRGLAWQAGEDWKLQAYRNGEEVYKKQASLMFVKPVDLITKEERQLGKAGELSCGYGAGPEAVRDFCAKMGLVLSEGEAIKLVKDWRVADPRTVDYWNDLNSSLHMAVSTRAQVSLVIPHGQVQIIPTAAPASLKKQTGDPRLQSLLIKLVLHDGTNVLTRVIHGVHETGHNLGYWKPSERKTGDLWVDYFVNPKTRRQQKHTLYGGKMAGLLTQSLCREVFFTSLYAIHDWCARWDNVQVVGQFHDEIVLDWSPTLDGISFQEAERALNTAMTSTILPEFPLVADIKSDYRYTK